MGGGNSTHFYYMHYLDKKINKNSWMRTFIGNDAGEYSWHRDREYRTVEIVNPGKGWYFQNDNCLPVLLEAGMKINIEKHVFHRLIAGEDLLKIKITILNECDYEDIILGP